MEKVTCEKCGTQFYASEIACPACGHIARSTDAPLEMVPVPDRQRRDWKPLAKRAGLCVVRRMFFRNSLARFASSLRALHLQPLSIFAEALQSCVDWFRL